MIFLTFSLLTGGSSPSDLSRGLDPYSIPQQLALYELFPESPEGQAAQRRAWQLLSGGAAHEECQLTPISSDRLMTLVNLLAKQRLERAILLSPEEVEAIELVGQRLPHHQLKGHALWSEAELLALPEEEFDLARALLLSLNQEPSQIRSYEATLDLMALQILTKVSLNSPPEAKIQAINHYLFKETGIRFPPHALFAKEIDHYTFLPSVIDGQRGVCLGVSSLYLCLAQRLNLPMEVVTPPGHIYVRYRDPHREINVETTMRGVHLPSSNYLGVQTRSLQLRTIKEVVGLTFQNQASVEWQRGRHEAAAQGYQKALTYIPDDLLIQELLGYNLILIGQEAEGRLLLEKVRGKIPDHAISANTMVGDLLDGRVTAEAISCCFEEVDETRESILAKQEEIRKVVEQFPDFSAGWFAYAVGWLQLGRNGEALKAIQRAHELNPNDETVEYYLAALSTERYDFKSAWSHLRRAEELVAKRNYHPRALRELRHALRRVAPE